MKTLTKLSPLASKYVEKGIKENKLNFLNHYINEVSTELKDFGLNHNEIYDIVNEINEELAYQILKDKIKIGDGIIYDCTLGGLYLDGQILAIGKRIRIKKYNDKVINIKWSKAFIYADLTEEEVNEKNTDFLNYN